MKRSYDVMTFWTLPEYSFCFRPYVVMNVIIADNSVIFDDLEINLIVLALQSINQLVYS